jgi:hydrogenase expression/formation protein HypC
VCLAIPGKIVGIQVLNGIRIACVQFGGITRETCLDCVPEASLGDYVLVHVGFAISIVDRQEAERTYALLESMDLLNDELGPCAGQS